MLLLNHIGIVTDKIEESKRFYCDVLDFKVEKTYEDESLQLVFLGCINGTIELVHKKNQSALTDDGAIQHIAFTVNDINKEVMKLKEKNVKLINSEPIELDGSFIIFFEGPNGEKLEYVQKIIHK